MIVNKNRLPYDKNPAAIASGIRLGTPIVTRNGMGREEMHSISELLDAALKGIKAVRNKRYQIYEPLHSRIRDDVKAICGRLCMH
jgi:glycine hydroxymethyltransferase